MFRKIGEATKVEAASVGIHIDEAKDIYLSLKEFSKSKSMLMWFCTVTIIVSASMPSLLIKEQKIENSSSAISTIERYCAIHLPTLGLIQIGLIWIVLLLIGGLFYHYINFDFYYKRQLLLLSQFLNKTSKDPDSVNDYIEKSQKELQSAILNCKEKFDILTNDYNNFYVQISECAAIDFDELKNLAKMPSESRIENLILKRQDSSLTGKEQYSFLDAKSLEKDIEIVEQGLSLLRQGSIDRVTVADIERIIRRVTSNYLFIIKQSEQSILDKNYNLKQLEEKLTFVRKSKDKIELFLKESSKNIDESRSFAMKMEKDLFVLDRKISSLSTNLRLQDKNKFEWFDGKLTQFYTLSALFMLLSMTTFVVTHKDSPCSLAF